MRPFPILVVLTLVIPLVPASGGGHVDAGASLVAKADEDFPLAGHAEGFAGAVSVAWSSDSGCAIADPAALETTARCAAAGVHALTLTATDGASTASDVVLVGVTREATRTLLHATGTVVVGTLGQSELPGAKTFIVPPGLTRLVATLTWEDHAALRSDLDLALRFLGQAWVADGSAKPEVVTVQSPPNGAWSVTVNGYVAAATPWTLDIVGVVTEGGADLPSVSVTDARGPAGSVATLAAAVTGGTAPYEIAWETDASSWRFDDGAGTTLPVTIAGRQVVRAKVTDAAGHEAFGAGVVRARGTLERPVTVVAVIDSSFSPYHYDFLGEQHPWMLDDDATNDIDFDADPSTYIAGLPPLEPLRITLPEGPDEDVNALRVADADAWSAMKPSTSAAPHAYWIPGTKVVAALRFSSSAFQAGNAAHGTASASVAAGNVHGTCPECLVVLMSGNADEAIRWAAAQPWIDVITNSYGAGSLVQGLSGGRTRDNAYWGSPLDATREASEEGQVIVFSAGNGLLNAFDVPMFTYWSSQKGPDWMVTVGAVDPTDKQTYSGAGKPVDVSSIGSSYPASGGATANGVGAHSGTSNAAPVTAGTFAKVLQEARVLLGDRTPGHADGVVASGAPVACGPAEPACALGDGVLTRRELEDAVYANVLPSATDVRIDTTWPTTPLAYHYQGHGVILGRLAGPAWEAESGRMVANLRGDAAAHPRPAGEENWFLVDSKCRQRLWGAWSGGLYQGEEPTFDPLEDQLSLALYAWCTAQPEGAFVQATAYAS